MLKKQPRLYYKSSGERCDKIQIEFTVDVNVLVWIAYYLLEVSTSNLVTNDKLTKKKIEDKLRDRLEWEGRDWIEKMEYEDLNKERLERARSIIRELYPKWHINYHNKSHNYIMED
jgi:hypothetical protein